MGWHDAPAGTIQEAAHRRCSGAVQKGSLVSALGNLAGLNTDIAVDPNECRRDNMYSVEL
jgi:hypothetical protein